MEQRVAVLEADMKDVKASLQRLELGFARIEERLSFVAMKEDLGRIESRIGQMEGRVSQIPTTWQIIGILAALLFGVASLVYATTNFLAQKPATPTTQIQAK